MGAPAPPVIAVAAPVAMPPRQIPLFARKARIQFPRTIASADSLGEVEADDGLRYYIKGDAHGRSVRASEWIATHLAEDTHIGAPSPAMIELQNGDLVFGSRRISGVADAAVTTAFLTTPTLSNVESGSKMLQELLSSIYAFDMFVFNDDRHFGNYLTTDDNGTRRLYAFDFSRALFWHWPWNNFPPLDSNTRRGGTVLRKMHGFDAPAASVILDRIERLAPGRLESFITEMPSDWLPAPVRAQFVDWWSNGGRTARLTALRTGIASGALL